MPRILTREVLTTIQYFTTEEQIIEAARDLTRLPRGTCFLYLAGQGVSQVQIPRIRDSLVGLPKSAARKLAQLRAEILSRPEFDTTANLQRKRIEIERQLVHFLNESSEARRLLVHESTPLLILPTPSEKSIIRI